MRYMRVDTILRSDLALSKKLSEPAIPIQKPDGSGSTLFSREVVALTRFIHNNGLDSQTLHRSEVVLHAVKTLITGEHQLPKIEEPAASGAGDPVKNGAPKKAAAVKQAKASDTKAAKVKAAKVKVAKPEAEKPEAETKPEPVKPALAATTTGGPYPFVVGTAVVSNLMAGCQLLRAYSNGDTNCESIATRLDAIIDEIQATAKIPSSAKSSA